MQTRSSAGPGVADAEVSLERLPLLARLQTEDVRALAQRGRARRFREGDMIVREGDPGDALYVVLEGRARILVSSSLGDEATVADLGPGDCIGEFSVLDGLPRSATAVATTDVRTLGISREDFREWLEARPAAAFALLEELSMRLRRANQGLADQLFLGLSQRLARKLVSLAQSGGTPVSEGEVRVRVTQAELASMLGVTRESVNKELQQFAARGWLRTARGAITISDVQALNLYR